MTSSRPLKLLFLLPFAPDLRGSHGGSRSTAAMVDMLSKDHRVCVLYLSDANDPAPRKLPGGCERMIAVPVEGPAAATRSLVRRFNDSIAQLLWRDPDWVGSAWSPLMASEAAAAAAEFEPDVVHYEFHVMAQYIPAVRTACPRAQSVVTEHEPGIVADARDGGFPTLRQILGGAARKQAWRRYEWRALRRADAIIAFTDSDAALLGRLLGPDKPPITVISPRLAADALPAAVDAPPVESDFLFVGNFRHPPNVDAAQRLVEGIFPLILRDLPDAKLTIVGANPPADLVAAESECVTVTGWVDDPSIYLAGAAIVLVPLRQGGGLRVKMLEACAAGTAIIASPMAVEGLALTDGEEVLLAETDEEFAAKAVALMASPETRARLAAASRRWSEKEQDTGQWKAQYAGFYAALGSPGDYGAARRPARNAL